MTVIESLEPHENQRVMDLVAAAGVDVQPWAMSRKGPVKTPASNPAYCYEWAFIQPGQVVVLNVWHPEIREKDGVVWCKLNLRAWAEKGRHSEALLPSERSALRKRAIRMDDAIACAFNEGLPVRVIVGEGSQRDISSPKAKASRMTLRLLDPEPWFVERYNQKTGECRLVRGKASRYVDQYTIPELKAPVRREVNGTAWERDRKVRDTALSRAKGQCELCKQRGFRMVGGEIYLETHHVIPLSENGIDHVRNVVAVCPNDHREAHHGERREEIRSRLLVMLAEMYG
jgi:5-methylcytosine-specific restriction protein A